MLSSSGRKDLRGAYGLHAREMCAWLLQMQQARAVNVVLLGVLETVTDEFNRVEHRLQMEGARTRASSRPLSIRSSPCSGSPSTATARRRAPLSVPRRILGNSRRRTEAVGSTRSRSRISASCLTSSPARPPTIVELEPRNPAKAERKSTMTFDFNTATEQRSFDVIPDGTIAVVQLNIRPGNAGENGLLKRSKTGEAEGLDAEFTVVEGPYAKRKFFGFMILSGVTDGHQQAADITRARLRGILESARGIKPADVSESAKKARVAEFDEFDGIRFMAKIGVEPARATTRPRTSITEAITPDKKEWHPIEQLDRPLFHANAGAGPARTPQPAPAARKVTKTIPQPAWARRAQ